MQIYKFDKPGLQSEPTSSEVPVETEPEATEEVVPEISWTMDNDLIENEVGLLASTQGEGESSSYVVGIMKFMFFEVF